MADRYGFQYTSSLTPRVWLVDGYVATGATGAVLNTAAGTYLDVAGQTILFPRGVKSVVRDGTGLYTITLGKAAQAASEQQTDTYTQLLSVDLVPVCTSATDLKGQVVSWNLASGGLSTTMSTVQIRFVNSSGNATDPPNGGGFLFALHLTNSQVSR